MLNSVAGMTETVNKFKTLSTTQNGKVSLSEKINRIKSLIELNKSDFELLWKPQNVSDLAFQYLLS